MMAVCFSLRGQHSALFNTLEQHSTALILQNQAGEGNEIHISHTHLPRPTGSAGQGQQAEYSKGFPGNQASADLMQLGKGRVASQSIYGHHESTVW